MMQKITYEFVKEQFETRDILLISTEYTGAHHLLEYQCHNKSHGTQRISWSNFKKGRGCRKCFGESTRLSYNDVLNAFNNAGYELISKEYNGSGEHLKYKCSNIEHNVQSMSFSNFSKGHRCPQCSLQETSKRMKLSYEDVKKSFEDRGFTIVSTEYKGAKYPIDYICKAHGLQTITYNDFSDKRGYGCKQCGNDAKSRENNYLWTGTTELVNYVRSSVVVKYHKECLSLSNYTCGITGIRGGDLEVHHTYAFHMIITDTMIMLNLPIKPIGEYSEDQLNSIKATFSTIQASHESVVLSKAIHKLFHDTYGRKDFTVADFQEFRERYDNNEFADRLRAS